MISTAPDDHQIQRSVLVYHSHPELSVRIGSSKYLPVVDRITHAGRIVKYMSCRHDTDTFERKRGTLHHFKSALIHSKHDPHSCFKQVRLTSCPTPNRDAVLKRG